MFRHYCTHTEANFVFEKQKKNIRTFSKNSGKILETISATFFCNVGTLNVCQLSVAARKKIIFTNSEIGLQAFYFLG